MFLLHFYENGAIYGLEPYKRCAVELAALAIYNHTNKYTYLEGSTKLYERSVFSLNPISYLLRVCDDLQEWERIYFEISDKANLILCNKCHTPLVRRKIKQSKTVFYDCACNKLDKHQIEELQKQNEYQKIEESGIFTATFKRQHFPYRRMYNVVVCENMTLHVKEDETYVFDLDYNLEKLLNITYITTEFAKYRIQELNKVKKLFVRQSEMGRVYLNYFVTPNILLIKARIVSKYLVKCKKRELNVEDLHIDEIINSFFDLEDKIDKVHKVLLEKSCDVIREFEDMGIKKNKNKQNKRKEYLVDSFNLYIYIALVMKIGKYKNKLLDRDVKKQYDSVIAVLWKKHKNTRLWSDDIGILLKDCCIQSTRMYDGLGKLTYYPADYMKQYEASEEVYQSMKKFTDSDRYQPLNKRTDMVMDAYTDLYWFKIILNKLRQC